MNHITNTFAATLCTALLWHCTFDACVANPPAFKSQLFKAGTLIYSDDFDGEYNRKRWGAPKKKKHIKELKIRR